MVKVGNGDVKALDDFSRQVAKVKNTDVTLTLNRDGDQPHCNDSLAN